MMREIITVIIVAAALSSCDKETLIAPSELPNEINTYISTHFPSNAIIQSSISKENLVKNYDILLDESIGLQFNRKKEIIEIESISKLPDSVIPEKLRNYVITNYPSKEITDWQLDDKQQQIELNNDISLVFTMQGDFVRID